MNLAVLNFAVDFRQLPKVISPRTLKWVLIGTGLLTIAESQLRKLVLPNSCFPYVLRSTISFYYLFYFCPLHSAIQILYLTDSCRN
jgi:hypothetical protein